MKIALVGFGKMGHCIKNIAENRGHEVELTVDPFAKDASVITSDVEILCRSVKASGVDGVIEFSHPSCVIQNIKSLLPLSVPLVVGTTGWSESLDEIEKFASSSGGTLVHSSNFSIGVNLFYKIVEEATKLFAPYSEYDVALWEM
ncbi:MAG: 4-hydroxy-tetrahydrodipicolinate reductase, partial [Treponema sp.]|nr:4-hydroxy-tetrahydrodipicolinate reductase [Treponema sp.]